MVGIKDIASQAGVSISTVSYALNNSPKVKEETRSRIMKIADEMNYIPNMAGRTLKRQQTNLIGVYLTNYGGSFYGSLLEGVTKTLGRHGYDMIVCSGTKSHLFLPEKLIDGAIILDATFPTAEIEKYAERELNIVVLDRELESEKVCHVLLDNQAGTTLALDYLLAQSPTKTYIVTGPDHTYDSNIRLAIAKQELERFEHIEYEVLEGNFTKESGMRAAKKIAEKNEKNVAVFCLNDEMAIGMYDYLAKTDLEIGKDIRIIGFDHSEVSRYIQPRLATVDYSMYKWGAVAAEKILALLEGTPAKSERIYTTLIRGESVEGVQD